MINFPGQSLGQIDDLFVGHRYTDYNVTFQSQKGGAAELGAEVSSIVSGAADIATSNMGVPFNTPHEGMQEINEQTNDNSLVHASLSVLHLTSH